MCEFVVLKFIFENGSSFSLNNCLNYLFYKNSKCAYKHKIVIINAKELELNKKQN